MCVTKEEDRIRMNWIIVLLGSLSWSCLPVSVVGEQTWEFLTLAQFWPTTSCVYFQMKESDCTVPPSVTGWTIHGLWPSRKGKEQPENCNSSLKFNYDEIKDLGPELQQSWPYFNKSGERTELWEHEWDKHGTCAYVLPALQGEPKYFRKALDLHRPLNTFEALRNASIEPSKDKLYCPGDIFNAVHQAYGKMPNIACLYDNNNYKHYLEQVWLCFDKQFNMIDCPEVQVSKPHYRHSTYLNRRMQKMSSVLRFESETCKEPEFKYYFSDCDVKKPLVYAPIPSNQPVQEIETLKITLKEYREYYKRP